MEGSLLEKDKFTAEYRFAKNLVLAVFDMTTNYGPSFRLLQQNNASLTVEQKEKVKELFVKEGPQLDAVVKRFTNGKERLNYGDGQFLSCVEQLMEEYKPELKSEEEFLLICSKIAYVASSFLIKNDQSDAIMVAVDRVYKILIYTFYPDLNKYGPIIPDVRDGKYRFTYNFIKILMEIRGITVPDLEVPNEDHCVLTSEHKSKLKEWLDNERLCLDEHLTYFKKVNWKYYNYDDNLLQYMNMTVEFKGLLNITKDEFLILCSRIAYAAMWFQGENSKSKAFDLAVDYIHQLIKKTVHFNIYDQDNDYRFACDLVKAIAEMRNNSFSFGEMSHSCSSFFMIAHRNKIEDLLSRERLDLEKAVKQFVGNGEVPDYNDNQFQLCMNYILNNNSPVYKSKEELVLVCTRLAYISAYFLRKNHESNASRLAMDRMLKIVKDIDSLPNSSNHEIFIMRTHDKHFRFAYDLVKTVLELKCVPFTDIDLPQPGVFLFKDIHRSKIEQLLSKESSKFDKVVEKFTNMYGIFDYGDETFIECMQEIMQKYQYGQKTEEGLLFISAAIGYLSACFCKNNWESNASFFAVNRIYEMIKDCNCFSDSTEEQVLIVKDHDEHYRFACALIKMIFEIKGIPVTHVELPAYESPLLTDAYKKQIQDLSSEDWFQINQMKAYWAKDTGSLEYSDNKFVYCMNQVEHQFVQFIPETKFAIIACMAADFLAKNSQSNSVSLAVNRIYELSKKVFCNQVDETIIKDDYHFAYDLVHAVLRLKNNSSFITKMPVPSSSPLVIEHRKEIENLLSKEWPRLHQLVRRFTKTFTAFSDSHFLRCMYQIINDNPPEKGFLLLSTRIAYVAICFLSKNQDSHAADLALDSIYHMRKHFYQHSEVKILLQDTSDIIFCFAIDFVNTVIELQGAPLPDQKLPNPYKTFFTSQYRKTIQKFLVKDRSQIDSLIKKATTKDGNSDCSDDIFQKLMDQTISDNKREQENINGSVRHFARIAYPVSYFLAKNNKSNSFKLAIQRICEIVSSSNCDLDLDE